MRCSSICAYLFMVPACRRSRVCSSSGNCVNAGNWLMNLDRAVSRTVSSSCSNTTRC